MALITSKWFVGVGNYFSGRNFFYEPGSSEVNMLSFVVVFVNVKGELVAG